MNLYTSHKLNIDLCPERLKTNLFNWASLNPSFKFVYVNDEQMKDWMYANTDESVIQIYNELKTGAGKADLYRLCRVNTEGGIWVDADIIAIDILKQNSSFLNLFNTVDVVLIKSRYFQNPRFAILSGKPNNALYSQTIKNALHSCNYAKKYLRIIPGTVHLTGPEILKHTICKMFSLNKVEHIELDKVYSTSDCSFIMIDDITLDSSDTDKPDTYKGYGEDLKSMYVTHHLKLPGI